ncbi:MAG: hypothetical protein AAF968_16715 [Pseudomonadota bacterium]
MAGDDGARRGASAHIHCYRLIHADVLVLVECVEPGALEGVRAHGVCRPAHVERRQQGLEPPACYESATARHRTADDKRLRARGQGGEDRDE